MSEPTREAVEEVEFERLCKSYQLPKACPKCGAPREQNGWGYRWCTGCDWWGLR